MHDWCGLHDACGRRGLHDWRWLQHRCVRRGLHRAARFAAVIESRIGWCGLHERCGLRGRRRLHDGARLRGRPRIGPAAIGSRLRAYRGRSGRTHVDARVRTARVGWPGAIALTLRRARRAEAPLRLDAAIGDAPAVLRFVLPCAGRAICDHRAVHGYAMPVIVVVDLHHPDLAPGPVERAEEKSRRNADRRSPVEAP